MSATIAPPEQVNAVREQPEMKVDVSQLKSSYCNVCSAMSTREEVVMNFGINQNWDLRQQQSMEVALHHRIIMSPAAAQRFHDLLSQLLVEHKARHGSVG